jgi:redox-sensitive bicupin YhaK (pirin superfamily)
MDRKSFIKKALVTGTAGVIVPTVFAQQKHTDSIPNKVKQEGYNHLPNKEIKTMKTVIHKANTRGQANHGWLKANHSFSFANYHNPERMNFGVLRVLNDDQIAGGMGFGKHPHENMEIITIPLSGQIKHEDSIGNSGIISPGEIQVMSAGTGIQHSEFNKNQDQELKLLQIWLIPNKSQVTPRYDQLVYTDLASENGFTQILSPNVNDAGVWIHQNAWFHLGEMKPNNSFTYTLNDPSNGVYAFIIEGKATIENESLNHRDGMGIWDSKHIKINSHAESKILLMEVPMQFNN